MRTMTREEVKLKLRPNYDFVLVRRIDEEVSGTILKPEAYRQKSDKAVVISVGPGRIVGSTIMPIEYVPGAIVFVSKHGGTDVELNGEKFTILRAGDVYGELYEDEDSST
jgi:chaperonin GroES